MRSKWGGRGGGGRRRPNNSAVHRHIEMLKNSPHKDFFQSTVCELSKLSQPRCQSPLLDVTNNKVK